MSVQELERAVTKLSPEEFAQFVEWLEEYRADEWDRQIEADAKAGRLDALVREAEDDIAADRIRPLP